MDKNVKFTAYIRHFYCVGKGDSQILQWEKKSSENVKIAYVRVSTQEQNLDRQLELLKPYGIEKFFGKNRVDNLKGKWFAYFREVKHKEIYCQGFSDGTKVNTYNILHIRRYSLIIQLQIFGENNP